MQQHEFRRSASVYAVLAIIAVLAMVIGWIGFKSMSSPYLVPLTEQTSERHGWGEDILPDLVHPQRCDEDRPCT